VSRIVWQRVPAIHIGVGISFRRMMPYYEWRFGVARRADVIDNHVNFPRAVMTGTCAISVAARALRSLITVKKLMERKFFVRCLYRARNMAKGYRVSRLILQLNTEKWLSGNRSANAVSPL